MNTVFDVERASAGSLHNFQICSPHSVFGCCIAIFSLLAFSAALNAQGTAPPVDTFSGKPRVVIISDIGNEPDDQMSFVRLLVYSNELDLEAMIATTSTWQKTSTHPETMHMLIHAYGEVRNALDSIHAVTAISGLVRLFLRYKSI